MKSAEVFGPFIFVHLMCNMIQLACAVFQLDLVIYPWFPSHLRAKEFIEFLRIHWISGAETHWFQRCFPRHGITFQIFEPECFLFIWKIGYGQLRTNGRSFIRIELVWAAGWIAKTCHHYDWEYATAHLLSWIWKDQFRFGHTLQCKTLYSKFFQFEFSNDFFYSCSEQFILITPCAKP